MAAAAPAAVPQARAPPPNDVVGLMTYYNNAPPVARGAAGAAGPDPRYKEIATLLNNGLYYQQSANMIGALVSYSSAATYIHAIGPDEAKGSNGFKLLLGYIEQLNEKVKNFNVKSNTDEAEDKEYIEKCLITPKSGKDTFANVIGMTKEKELITTAIIKPLVYPNLFTKTAKGVLLYGPPGTGKTFIVKALEKQLSLMYPEAAQVLFFPLTGADLKGKYVGETEKKISQAYRCAARWACQRTTADDPEMDPAAIAAAKGNGFKKQYVSIVFIDEFDSVGRDRSQDETGMMANSVNTLLQMMDGVTSYKNVITIAATNYPWDLDAALLRRFNEHIYVRPPRFNDIKKLIDFEMVTRFTVILENYLEYCVAEANPETDSKKGRLYKLKQKADEVAKAKAAKYGKIKKVLKDVSELPDKKTKIEKTKEALSFLKFVNTDYMMDNSPAMMALVAKLASQNRSNSDIASIVQKAFNSVAKCAIENGQWHVLEHKVDISENNGQTKTETDQYLLSCFTKIDPKAFAGKKYGDIEGMAISENNISNNILDPNHSNNKIDYTGTGKFIDIPAIPDPYNEKGINSRLVIPSIKIDGEAYINILFMNDRPSWLILDTTGIDAIYVKAQGGNSLAFFGKNPGATKGYLEKLELDLIFTRTMTVTNDSTSLTPPASLPDYDTAKKMIDEFAAWKSGTDYSYSKLLTLKEQILDNYKLYASAANPPINIDNISAPDTIIAWINRQCDGGICRRTNPKQYETLSYKTYVEGSYDGWLGVGGKIVKDLIIGLQSDLLDWIERTAAGTAAQGQTPKSKYETYSESLSRKSTEAPNGIKRTFFFKTSIHPYQPSYTEFKAGGSFFTESAFKAIKGAAAYFSDLVGKTEEETDFQIRSYLASEKVTFLDYLLARVTHIGLLNNVMKTGDKDEHGDDSRFKELGMMLTPEQVADENKAAAPAPAAPAPAPAPAAAAPAPAAAAAAAPAGGGDLPDFTSLCGSAAGATPVADAEGGALAINRVRNAASRKKHRRAGRTTFKARRSTEIENPQVGGNRPDILNIRWFEIDFATKKINPFTSPSWWAQVPTKTMKAFKGFPVGEKEIHFESVMIKTMFTEDTIYVKKLEGFTQNFQKCFGENIVNYLDKLPEVGSMRSVFKLLSYYPKLNSKTRLQLMPTKRLLPNKLGGAAVFPLAVGAVILLGPIVAAGTAAVAAAVGVSAGVAALAGSAAMAAGNIACKYYLYNKDQEKYNTLIIATRTKLTQDAVVTSLAAFAGAGQVTVDTASTFAGAAVSAAGNAARGVVAAAGLGKAGAAAAAAAGPAAAAAPAAAQLGPVVPDITPLPTGQTNAATAVAALTESAATDLPPSSYAAGNQPLRPIPGLADSQGAPAAGVVATALQIAAVANFFGNIQQVFEEYTEGKYYYHVRYENNPDIRYITLKRAINDATLKIGDTNRLNFYMDPSFLDAASAEYPPTWDATLGKALQDYDDNRVVFLEELKSGKRTLKRKEAK